MKTNRLNALDIFRGYAIILMIGYHFAYYLNFFGFLSSHPNRDIEWIIVRYSIVFIFLLSMGMSLKLAHPTQIMWHKMKKRTLLLGGASLLVSVATYLQMPSAWVYFGILHFILLSSWLGLFFLFRPHLTLVAILAIVGGSLLGWLKLSWLFVWLKAPLHLPPYTQDFVPLFPWFGVVLLGIWVVQMGYHERFLSFVVRDRVTLASHILGFLGRHSLVIYLVHPPIMYGLFWVLR